MTKHRKPPQPPQPPIIHYPHATTDSAAEDDNKAEKSTSEKTVADLGTTKSEATSGAGQSASAIVGILVSEIDPSPYQPRMMFSPEAIDALAASIESEGQLVPISVRSIENGRYQLIAGERRLKAHEILGRTVIQAYIVETRTDFDAAVAALADNEARTDLSDYERGKAFRRLLAMPPLPGVRRLTQSSLAKRIAKSEATISRCMTYFNLPDAALALLDRDPWLIGGKNAMTLAGLAKKGHEDIVVRALKKIKEDGLSEQGAVNWAVTESTRVLQLRPNIFPVSVDGIHIGDMKTDGIRVIISCKNGFSPEELLNRIRSADLSHKDGAHVKNQLS